MGFAENVNVQGEEQRKLDVFADDVIVRLNDHTGRLGGLVSEEREDWIPIPSKYPKGIHQRVPVFIGNRSLVERAEANMCVKN